MFRVSQLITEPAEKLSFLKPLKKEFRNTAELLISRAQELPDSPYIYFYDETISYSMVNDRANKIAHYLKEKGLKRGNLVSFMIPNSPDIHYTIFAAQKLGVTAGAVNFMLTPTEIAFQIDDCRPEVMFVHIQFMETFKNAYYLAAHKPVVIAVGDSDDNFDLAETNLKNILKDFSSDEIYYPFDSETSALLLYSSGTTGNPKGILLPHRTLLSVGSSMCRLFMNGDRDVFLMILPMFHSNPLCIWTYAYMYGGGSICIRKTFSPADFWPTVQEYGITLTLAVPTMYNYIYHSVNPDNLDMSQIRLRFAGSGAAPLSLELLKGFQDKFGIKILEGYGLTEAGGVSSMNPPYGDIKPGSIGMALPDQEIAIMDDNDEELPAGKIGEICIKGDTVMTGYLNRDDATSQSLYNGWLHTGDLGYFDEEGYLYMSGRKKEMINRGGENIYPREIESVLEKDERIKEVAVIGVPDKALGEKVKAFILPVKEDSLTEEVILEFLKDRIAKYKMPEYIEITESLPMTATGKIMKKELIEMEKERYEKKSD